MALTHRYSRREVIDVCLLGSITDICVYRGLITDV